MKFLSAIFIILFIASSCKDKTGEPVNNTTGTDSAKATNDSSAAYLPIGDLIREDIQRVDSFAGGLLKKTTINGKKDSAFITPQQFHQAAAAFLIPELEPTAFRKSFTENSHQYGTTEMLQFIYTPNKPATALRNVVV